MKAVAPHPLVVERARQGIAVRMRAASRWKAVSKQATCGTPG